MVKGKKTGDFFEKQVILVEPYCNGYVTNSFKLNVEGFRQYKVNQTNEEGKKCRPIIFTIKYVDYNNNINNER